MRFGESYSLKISISNTRTWIQQPNWECNRNKITDLDLHHTHQEKDSTPATRHIRNKINNPLQNYNTPEIYQENAKALAKNLEDKLNSGEKAKSRIHLIKRIARHN